MMKRFFALAFACGALSAPAAIPSLTELIGRFAEATNTIAEIRASYAEATNRLAAAIAERAVAVDAFAALSNRLAAVASGHFAAATNDLETVLNATEHGRVALHGRLVNQAIVDDEANHRTYNVRIYADGYQYTVESGLSIPLDPEAREKARARRQREIAAAREAAFQIQFAIDSKRLPARAAEILDARRRAAAGEIIVTNITTTVTQGGE